MGIIMNKKQKPKIIKLQILAGNATPASSIGPMLGQHGINIMKFCKDFNQKTKDQLNMPLPTSITIYPNKTYSFSFKNPPASILIKQKLGLSLTKKPGSGSKNPGKEIIQVITYSQLKDIATTKKTDLNSYSIKSAIKIIAGTAKSMGINIKK